MGPPVLGPVEYPRRKIPQCADSFRKSLRSEAVAADRRGGGKEVGVPRGQQPDPVSAHADAGQEKSSAVHPVIFQNEIEKGSKSRDVGCPGGPFGALGGYGRKREVRPLIGESRDPVLLQELRVVAPLGRPVLKQNQGPFLPPGRPVIAGEEE